VESSTPHRGLPRYVNTVNAYLTLKLSEAWSAAAGQTGHVSKYQESMILFVLGSVLYLLSGWLWHRHPLVGLPSGQRLVNSGSDVTRWGSARLGPPTLGPLPASQQGDPRLWAAVGYQPPPHLGLGHKPTKPSRRNQARCFPRERATRGSTHIVCIPPCSPFPSSCILL